MDWRVVAVLAPILIAGGWAVFNILAVALGQVQSFLNKNS
ncbi:MAG: photosystem II protein Y [Cyanobacteria bacterium P01_E01_bin.42]